MRIHRVFILMFSYALCLPLLAQEEDTHQTVPPPLNDAFINWMIGEWRGETSSQMGKSSDYMKFELALNGQFVIMTYESKTENGQTISGLGALTQDKEGNTVGYWIDSWRTMSEGKGFREGNLSTIKWSTQEGVYIRTTEKIDENTMHVTGSMTDASGQKINSESTFKRILK